MPPTIEELEKRIALLETSQITINDLPMQALKNDLQDSWSVEGSRLVAPRSVRPESLFLPKLSTVLPAEPDHGQIAEYQVSEGINWVFKYNAASASTYKWEAIGAQTPMYHEIQTDEATSATHTTYQSLATVGPTLTIPLAGDYWIQVSCQCYSTTNGVAAFMTPKLGSAAVDDVNGIIGHQSTDNTKVHSPCTTILRTGLAAADVILCQYRTNSANSGNFRRRKMLLWPKRVTR